MMKKASEFELSNDARALLSAWFSFGEKCTVRIGGVGAKNELSDRASKAMDELVRGGFVVAREFNRFGRMEYSGTDKCAGRAMSMEEIEAHENFALTKTVGSQQEQPQ